MLRPTSRPVQAVAVATLAVVLLVLPRMLDAFWISNVIQIMVFGLLALSVALLSGHVNMVSLGHAAFFAVAAYATAYAQIEMGAPSLLAALVGIAASVLLALVFAFSVRTREVYFMLITLSMGMIVWGIATRWTSVTHGDNGIRNVRLPEVAGVDLADMSTYYYVVLVVVTLCIVAYRRLIHSPFGLILRGVRESESRMQSMGYNITAYRLAAFVISGLMAGVAGVLYVYWNAFVSPPTAMMVVSAEAKLMSIIGGSTTVIGAWLGSALITIIKNYVSAEFDRYMTVMGLVFIVTALYFPEGLLGRKPRPTVRFTPRSGVVEEGMNPSD